MIVAKKNAAYYLSFAAIDSTTPASYKSGVSPVDTAYYKDGAGAWTTLAITDTASEIGSTGVYELNLTASEMNHDRIIIKFSVSGMADDAYQFDLQTKLVDDLNDVAATAIVSGGAINTTAGAVDTATTLTNLPASAATATALATVDANVDLILTDTGTTIPATITTAQNDLDIITGATGVNLLAATQASIDAIEVDTSTTIQAELDAIQAAVITNAAGVDIAADIAALKVDTDSMGITKNEVFSNFQFPMVLTSDHYTAATAKTVTGEKAIDGGAFAAITGTIAEISDGVYQCDLLAADTNGDVITYKFSATNCDDTVVTVTTRA